jgi:hypothetical protein
MELTAASTGRQRRVHSPLRRPTRLHKRQQLHKGFIRTATEEHKNMEKNFGENIYY